MNNNSTLTTSTLNGEEDGDDEDEHTLNNHHDGGDHLGSRDKECFKEQFTVHINSIINQDSGNFEEDDELPEGNVDDEEGEEKELDRDSLQFIEEEEDVDSIMATLGCQSDIACDSLSTLNGGPGTRTEATETTTDRGLPTTADLISAVEDLLSSDSDCDHKGKGSTATTILDMEQRLRMTTPIWYMPNINRATVVHFLQGKGVGVFVVSSCGEL